MHAPDGWSTFAGDMMSVLTNGAIPAVSHRVLADRGGQAHIFFVQPSDDDEVEGSALFPVQGKPAETRVRFGTWHGMKKRRAYGGDSVLSEVAALQPCSAL
mmetsp:Transcript_127835/g.368108  ORF Transcript_127835/g.368108 Transcript_127835/m.368108 type:complete len:101 (+) Transcript_127835:640-942(+)